jgi:hypothetical protein
MLLQGVYLTSGRLLAAESDDDDNGGDDKDSSSGSAAPSSRRDGSLSDNDVVSRAKIRGGWGGRGGEGVQGDRLGAGVLRRQRRFSDQGRPLASHDATAPYSTPLAQVNNSALQLHPLTHIASALAATSMNCTSSTSPLALRMPVFFRVRLRHPRRSA